VSDGARLSIDGAAVGSEARVELPRGNHIVEVDGALGPGATLGVSWQPPGESEWRTLGSDALFVAPEGGTGLEATYYPTPTWTGEPQEKLIDPVLDHYYHLNPFRRLNLSPPAGWSAEWRGFIEVPHSGVYRFDVDRFTRAGLWIDERQVFDDTPTDAPEAVSGTLELTAGRHAIRVRLQDRAIGGPRMYLFWTPPAGQRQVVPGSALYPPRPELR
jgi:hypothetical protein